jgi:hypothetical protein
MECEGMDQYVIGTLMSVKDNELIYFVTDFELSYFRRWMFQFGWNVAEEIEFYRKGIQGYKITLVKRGQ